jgi:hypothetical protein
VVLSNIYFSDRNNQITIIISLSLSAVRVFLLVDRWLGKNSLWDHFSSLSLCRYQLQLSLSSTLWPVYLFYLIDFQFYLICMSSCDTRLFEATGL